MMSDRDCVRVLDLLRSLGYSWEEVSRMLDSGHPGPPEWPLLARDLCVSGWVEVRERFKLIGIPWTPEGLRQWLSRSRRADAG